MPANLYVVALMFYAIWSTLQQANTTNQNKHLKQVIKDMTTSLYEQVKKISDDIVSAKTEEQLRSTRNMIETFKINNAGSLQAKYDYDALLYLYQKKQKDLEQSMFTFTRNRFVLN